MPLVSSVLWRCWLGSRKGIRPVINEWWGAGVVICLERGADLHTAQLMPLPLTVSCFSEIQIGLPIWYRLTRVVADKGPLNGCVCVCGILTGAGRGAEISRQVPARKRLVPCRQGDGRVGRGESVEQRRRWEDCAGCCVAGHAEPCHSQGPPHRDLSLFCNSTWTDV